MPTPDLEGFRQAQVTLRERFGRDCVFLTPEEPTWPPGTPLNTETGRPFDPTIEPVSGAGFASATFRALVIDNPLTDDDSSVSLPAGWFEEGHMVLSLDVADDPGDATRVETFGQVWQIRDTDIDGVGDVPHRRLIHVEKVSG